VDVDPLASMRCWAITVELAGREYEIPALPAADWWPVVSDPDASSFLDLLKSTPGDDLDARLLDGTITGAALGEAMMDSVAEATGRSFHAAFVLATVAASQWPVIGGELAQRGFRWDVMPIGAALDAVYAIVVGGLEEKNREKFLALLEDETLSQPGKKRTPSQRVVGEFEAMAGPRPAPAPLPGGASAAPSGSQRPRTRTRPRPPRQDGRSRAPKRQP
jgi:hypothetical protein